MVAIASINGRICSEQDAVVSIFDHGFLFGEGVYEVVRTYHSEPFALDRHLRRLRKSAGMLRINVPMADAGITRTIHETIAASLAGPAAGADASDLYVRILLTRGVGDLTYNPASSPASTMVVIVKPLPPTPPEVYEKGVEIAVVSVVRNHPESVNPSIKSNNLLNSALATQEALQRGAYEALMRNYRGELAEGAQSNIFIVKGGELLTPPLAAGILAGITRELILELAPALGIPTHETTLRDEDLFGADEAFLSVTTREVVPVVRVGDRTIGRGAPGPVTLRVLTEFRRRARAGLPSRPSGAA